MNITLLGKVNDALYIVVGNLGLPGFFNDPLQFKVLFRVKAVISRFPFPDGGKQCSNDLPDFLGARHQGSDFLFFTDLPTDEFFDIRMIDIEADHFGCTTGGSSGFDGSCCRVPDFEKRHHPG